MRRLVLPSVAAVVVFAVVAASAQAARFGTTSGNVRCYSGTTGSGSPYVQCDDMEARRSISLLVTGRPSELAFHPTFKPKLRLPVGDSINAGQIRCTAKRYGMRCKSRRSGRGFALGSGVVRLR